MTDLEKRFIKARRDAIAVDYQNLNDCQRQGVLATEGGRCFCWRALAPVRRPC